MGSKVSKRVAAAQTVVLDLSGRKVGSSLSKPPPPELLEILATFTEVKLNKTSLSRLPSDLSPYVSLEQLHLESNRKLSRLPADIGSLQNLLYLNAFKCGLVELPPTLGDCPNLGKLILHKNKLTALPISIGRLQQLTLLFVGGNKLKTLPETLFDCTRLRELHAQENAIQVLSERVGDLTELRVLNLRNNKIFSLPDTLTKCTALEELTVYSNRIVSLPENIGACTALHSVQAQGNALAELPASLGRLTNLQTLNISSNPLRGPFKRLKNAPMERVIEYLGDLDAEQTASTFFLDVDEDVLHEAVQQDTRQANRGPVVHATAPARRAVAPRATKDATAGDGEGGGGGGSSGVSATTARRPAERPSVADAFEGGSEPRRPRAKSKRRPGAKSKRLPKTKAKAKAKARPKAKSKAKAKAKAKARPKTKAKTKAKVKAKMRGPRGTRPSSNRAMHSVVVLDAEAIPPPPDMEPPPPPPPNEPPPSAKQQARERRGAATASARIRSDSPGRPRRALTEDALTEDSEASADEVAAEALEQQAREASANNPPADTMAIIEMAERMQTMMPSGVLTLEHNQRQAYATLKTVVECTTWLAAVMGDAASYAPVAPRTAKTLAETMYDPLYLTDGVVLCRLINILAPGAVAKVNERDPASKKPLSEFQKLRNIKAFIKGARAFMTRPVRFFRPNDLKKGLAMDKVYGIVYQMAGEADAQGLAPGVVRIDETYNFERNQIALAVTILKQGEALAVQRASLRLVTGFIPGVSSPSFPEPSASGASEAADAAADDNDDNDDNDDDNDDPPSDNVGRGRSGSIVHNSNETSSSPAEAVKERVQARRAVQAKDEWLDESWQVEADDLVIAERIGEGVFGVVYRASYEDVPVAVKEINPSLMEGADEFMIRALEKLTIREIDVLKTLRHPNVLQFIGACRPDDDRFFIVTEFVPNDTLRNVLDTKGARLDWRMRCKFASDASRGLEYLHANRIIHRDIKSDNLLIDENWRVKIADFGFARVHEETANAQRRVMTMCGTDEYMPPELLLGLVYDETVDVYSFGIVMWELATNLSPASPTLERSPVNAFAFPIEAARAAALDGHPPGFLNTAAACVEYDPQSRPPFRILTPALVELSPSIENIADKLDAAMIALIEQSVYDDIEDLIQDAVSFGEDLNGGGGGGGGDSESDSDSDGDDADLQALLADVDTVLDGFFMDDVGGGNF